MTNGVEFLLGDGGGYDAGFLGTEVPLPRLGDEALAARLDDGTTELNYLHFTAVQNEPRKLPIFGVVNIDGKHTPTSINRKTGEITWPDEVPIETAEVWWPDERIGSSAQLTDDHYLTQPPITTASGRRRVPFDRGHMVRRIDPAWGSDDSVVLQAMAQTFHLTNCCPQEWRFNEQVSFWAGIENYAFKNAANQRERITVFSGPIFSESDPVMPSEAGAPEAQVPLAFWKIVVRIDPEIGLRSTGFMASQAELVVETLGLDPLQTEDWNDLGRSAAYLSPISTISERASLDFPEIVESADTYDGPVVELETAAAISW